MTGSRSARVLVIGTYESGHQPMHVAVAAAGLRSVGHDVTTCDMSVESLDEDLIAEADAIAIAVPMHTAMRLAVEVARHVDEVSPAVPVCLYGLYAAVASESLVGGIVDRAIAGEYLPHLVEWAGRAADGTPTLRPITTSTARSLTPVPDRSLLPPLSEYSRVILEDGERIVGYVETSRGCSHRCRHCPVPVAYDGRIRIIDASTVLSDIDALVDAGARHITFGDPDFLNGIKHSMRVIREMHDRHPGLTLDITTKVEHILRYREIWPELAEAGLSFVISAFETTNDEILGYLDKGHTAADMAEAIHLLRADGIEIRPSWLPFTPWTTVQDLVDIVDFVTLHDLFGNIDPVQMSIRLLIPNGSLMLEIPELAPHLGPFDAAALGYRWTAADPAADALQSDLALIAAAGADHATEPMAVIDRMWRAIAEAAGTPPVAIPAGATTGRPRSTEPWFC
ncbi:radical SAM protein [bacterium]|nr:radical SAM protein [bacterium]